jgi:hypothetical protein
VVNEVSNVVSAVRPPRADPLSGPEIEMTLKLLDSVRTCLATVGAGRPIHGTDAPAIRAACHRLGSILAALSSRAES